jgi:hypothetical protein
MTTFGLAMVAIFVYLDWITHREVVFAIVLGVLAAGAIVFHREIVARTNLGPSLAQIPAPVRPILAAIPGVVYFLARGQGTSGAGGVVLIAIALSVGSVAFFGQVMDAKLANLYATRNRVLPLPVRMALAIVLPILAAFLIMHGNLSDLPALFGGTTNHPMSPTGREGSFFLGTVVSSALAFLMLREAPRDAAEPSPTMVDEARSAATPTPVVAPAWMPTHTVPAQGMPAWARPDPADPVIANLDPGLDLRVVGTAGDWAQVDASNGWTGWVDGRLLMRRGS